MRRMLVFFLPTLLGFSTASPLGAEEVGEFPVKVHERVLENGFKILVIPRKGVPNASCALTYNVGSVNERVGQTGMAHYLEHMMFKGTKKTGVKDLAVDQKLRDALDAVIAETIRLEDGARTPEAEARIQALTEERLRLIDEQKQNLEINHLFRIYGEAGSTFTRLLDPEHRRGVLVQFLINPFEFGLPTDKVRVWSKAQQMLRRVPWNFAWGRHRRHY